VYSLNPAATTDEGNNWINMFYGPLSSTNASLAKGSAGYGVPLGNYSPAAGSLAIDAITSASPTYAMAPSTDFFGHARPDGGPGTPIDIGAVEFLSHNSAQVALIPGTWTPTATRGVGLLGPIQIFTLNNNSNAIFTGISQGTLTGANAADFTVLRMLSTCGPAGNGQLIGQTTLAVGQSCVVTVQFRPLTSEGAGAKSATLSVTDSIGTQTSTPIGTTR